MVKPELNATAAERIKGMVELRDCVNELIALQMDEYSAESQIQDTKSETFSIEVNEPNICCFWSCIARCRIVHNSPYNSTVWDIVMCMTIIQVEILIVAFLLPCPAPLANAVIDTHKMRATQRAKEIIILKFFILDREYQHFCNCCG